MEKSEIVQDRTKRNKDLKIVYNEGKRLINDLVDKRKKWLIGTGSIVIVFSMIFFFLYIYFDEPYTRNSYLFFLILYLVMGLFILILGYTNIWIPEGSHEHPLRVFKLHINEWYEFFNRVDYQKLSKEQYGLAEIILRIYYNIDHWLRIEYRINQIKYQFVFIILFSVYGISIPLDNSFFPIKEIGLICVIIALISSVIFLHMLGKKKMDEEVSKWHNKTKDLDNELWNLWRGY